MKKPVEDTRLAGQTYLKGNRIEVKDVHSYDSRRHEETRIEKLLDISGGKKITLPNKRNDARYGKFFLPWTLGITAKHLQVLHTYSRDLVISMSSPDKKEGRPREYTTRI